MPPPLALPGPEEIHAARSRLGGLALRTPVRLVRAGEGTARDASTSHEVFLKLETRQPIGSFKIRGAGNAIGVAPPEALKAGVWTASAGNMGQGVAWCARERGVPCRVVVPDHAPLAKLDAMRALGAELTSVPFPAWWDALIAREHPGTIGLMVHPFADTAVMAGNGTIGLELAEEPGDVDAVLVPWGGGGLAVGIACALRAVSPRTRVYAVEVETAAPLTASLAAGRPVTVHRRRTFIDGMGSDRVLEEMWPFAREFIAGTVVVTVAEVATAVRALAGMGEIVEGAGAAAFAAGSAGTRVRDPALDAGRVVCIISGGNIDRDVHAAILDGRDDGGRG